MNILTLNCGSSSVKYQLYDWDDQRILATGAVDRIAIPGASSISHYSHGQDKLEEEFSCPDHKSAINKITEILMSSQGPIQDKADIAAVGHRIVNGGEVFTKSVIIDDEAIEAFNKIFDMAPLHNPPAVSGINAARQIFTDIPHCVIVDTAWHQTMPPSSFLYALPYRWYKEHKIRRYGFHGSSLLYVAKRAAVLLNKNPFEVNLITLHIGNGASANAVKDGTSFDTSMGFTPMEGLVMGTRPGDHDAAIGYYMMNKENIPPKEMERLLNKECGVLGVTEKFADRRDIIKAAAEGNKRCELALEMEGYRLKKYIGAYYAALGRVDAIVFTAGVGEFGTTIRERALEGLEHLGIILDKKKNNLSQTRNAETLISADNSKIKIFVIPTDEELVMTEDTYALLQGTYDLHTKFTYSFQRPGYVNKQRAEALKIELAKKPELKEIIVQD